MDLYYQMTNVEYNHMLDMDRSMEKGIDIGDRKASVRIAIFMLSRRDSPESVA